MATTQRPGTRARLNVLHLVSTFAVKTDTKWLLQIAAHLDRERFALSCACFHGGGEVEGALRELGVATCNLSVAGAADPRAAYRAWRLIRRVAFDVVHTHLLRADVHGGLAARLAGVPVIVTTAYALGDYRREKRRWADPWLDELTLLPRGDVIAVSEAVAADCLARGWPPERVHTIRTGVQRPRCVDRERATALRKAWLREADGPLVLCIARLSYEKGLEVLTAAAARVAAVRPSVRFVVIGDGPQRERLEGLAASLDLTGRLLLPGFVAETWEALDAADVFCLPSHMEGMPNALLEAMAAGRAVVATRVGGVPEVVKHGVNGWLVPPGDSAELAEALLRMVDDEPLRRSLGDAARRTAERELSAADAVRRYGDLYESLMRRSGECNSRRDGETERITGCERE